MNEIVQCIVTFCLIVIAISCLSIARHLALNN